MTESWSRALEDRLSELPDSLILHVFELLPIIDVVRTTILSNRWKNLWTTITSLTFDDNMFLNTEKNTDFVNGVVKYWRGNKIFRFEVDLVINKSVFNDIDSWVRFACENGVEYLDLNIMYEKEEEEDYWLPQDLYSCSSLKLLSVEGCSFKVNGKVQWNRLKRLYILDGYLDQNLVNQILLGSPNLEIMGLSVVESDDSLSITSSSLKELVIEKFMLDYTDELTDSISELRICTPNLKKLRLRGIPYSRYLLQDISSLTLATLGFHGPSHYEYHWWYPLNDFIGKILREIFPAIQHVEKVELQGWSVQVLGAAEGESLLSPCPNVKILQLKGCLGEYEQILGLLEMFPSLTRLIIASQPDDQPIHVDDAESFSDLDFQSKSFLSQLRTVDVSWIKGDTSFYPLMKLVFKYASQLEKVEFRKRLNHHASDVEVSSFCISGTAGHLTKILTKMQS